MILMVVVTRYYIFFYYAPTMLIFFLDWLFNISMRAHSEVLMTMMLVITWLAHLQ